LFRTPIDYRDNGIMGFPNDTVPVDFFSGLYMVITVKNEFAAGEFKQTLELVRRPQQSPKPTAQSGEKGNQEIVTEKTDVNKESDTKETETEAEKNERLNKQIAEENAKKNSFDDGSGGVMV